MSVKKPGTRYIVDGVSMDGKTYAAYMKKKEKEVLEKAIAIEDMTELFPGMRIAEEKDVFNSFMIVHEKGYRDGLIMCLDDCGHSVLIHAYNGSYVILPGGNEKVRIIYGSSSDAPLKISTKYYFNEKDFIDKHPQYYNWYVEALRGTRRMIYGTTEETEP